jgi:glucan 1,3-beta-glucosidase
MVRTRILAQRTRLSTACFYIGYNHSGKLGQIDFLYGIMGMANAQRAMNYIRIITEFISQDEWKDVVVTFGIVNEALITTIGTTELRGL